MARTRGTGPSKGVWGAGIAAAAVLAFTGYAMLSGGDDGGSGKQGKGGASPSVSGSASPGATYQAPQDWTEPERWAALPRGERTNSRGSQVGFAHTTEGAVAMMVAANSTSIEADKSNVDEQLRIYHSYVSKKDQSSDTAEQIELQALQTDKSLHKDMSVSASQPLPSGAYVRSNVVGYKVIAESANEVSVWLLSRVVQKDGETAKEAGSYSRVVNGATWEDGDWKLSGAVTQKALTAAQKATQPQMVAPGDAAFNAAGWTALREAS
ncbi:hypothetical protein HEP84_35850 [Streptomyces sp. RLB1-33]|nr:hypothetical protein [Streptomyces sp. RLB1-33]QIY73727.1 hypothetical protein HEP84_35850 [Streptomyces sp. RLB1-33]